MDLQVWKQSREEMMRESEQNRLGKALRVSRKRGVRDVVSDAIATFDHGGPGDFSFVAEQVRRASLASLHEEFATEAASREVLERL